MNSIKRLIRLSKYYIVLHKRGIITASLLIIILVSGSLFYLGINSNKQSKRIAKIEEHVTKNPKSVEDLSKVEKEILGTEEQKSEEEIKKEKIIKEVEQKNITKEYKEYEKLPDKVKEKMEVIPRKEQIPISELEKIKKTIETNNQNETHDQNDLDDTKKSKETVNNLPESYNLKDNILLKVENQHNYGLCWDFTSMKSLETNYQLKEGKYTNLSELHLDYYVSNLMYGTREIHNGGTFNDFMDYSLLTEAVSEESVPYRSTSYIDRMDGGKTEILTLNNFKEEEYSKFTSINGVTRATEVVNFPSIAKKDGKPIDNNIDDEKLKEFRTLAKEHIMKNGSLYTVIAGPIYGKQYFDSKTNFQYYNGDDSLLDRNLENPFHAVSIVGWDDNYSKDNFNNEGKKPEHDGAYIALNSWGENWGNNGYFYISYDDALVESQLSGVVSTSMDHAIRIDDIQNDLVKDIINEKLKYYIIDYNNDKYITKVVLNRISSLDLKNRNLTSDDLIGLDFFDNVSSIDLSNNNISDVSVLVSLNRLYDINLSNNNVLDVSSLNELDNLSVLNLSGNNNVTGYEHLDNVTYLDLSNTNTVTLNDLSNNTKLNNLNLSNNTNLDYNNLKLPKKIGTLILDNTNLKNNKLKDVETVSDLSLKNNELTDLNNLKDIKGIYSLDISNNEISDYSALGVIMSSADDKQSEYFENKQLIAKNNSISDISIINNINVISVDLSNNLITDLSNFNNDKISEIKLSYNKIEKGIKNLKNIYTIYLDNCGISNTDELALLEKTSYLVLDGNNITDFNSLNNIKELMSLSLNDNKITDLSNISGFDNLYNLSIDNNDISDISPLNKIKKLNSLSLVGNTKIKGKLTGNISNINLSDCNIDNSFDLSGLKMLSYVDLSNNNYTNFSSIFNGTTSKWIFVKAAGINISEDDISKINIEDKDKKWSLKGLNLNIAMNLDQNNNISLENNYFIRKVFMQNISSDLIINNGDMNNKFEYIHVLDPNNKNVSFDIKNDLFSNYDDIHINISY